VPLVKQGESMFGRLVLTALLAVGFAAAQDDMGGGGGGRGGGGGGGRGGDMGASMGGAPVRKPNKVEQIADKLKLNKDQKETFGKILSAAAERAMTIRQQMDKARADLAGALIDAKPAEDVNKLTAAYAAVAAQMTKVEADAFAKIYASLEPKQQSKAEQAFELMAGVFMAPATGRGGGGMGRGGMGRGGR
jgi:uncharacterized membrane protein